MEKLVKDLYKPLLAKEVALEITGDPVGHHRGMAKAALLKYAIQ